MGGRSLEKNVYLIVVNTCKNIHTYYMWMILSRDYHQQQLIPTIVAGLSWRAIGPPRSPVDYQP